MRFVQNFVKRNINKDRHNGIDDSLKQIKGEDYGNYHLQNRIKGCVQEECCKNKVQWHHQYCHNYCADAHTDYKRFYTAAVFSDKAES